MKQFFLNPYGLSGLAIAVATLARMVMTPLWGAGYTFISYYPAILFSVWVGGWKAGLLATIVSGLLSLALFVPVEETGIPQLAAVTFFLVANGGIVLMAESWRRARVHAEAQAVRADARTEAQRLAGQAVQEQERRLVGILDAAMDAIITVDERQHIILFNPAAERMFGYRAADVLGTPLEPLIPSQFQSSQGEHIRQFGQIGGTSRRMGSPGIISGIRADGQEFSVEASMSQVDVGDCRWFTVILRDITERKRSQEALHDQLNLVKTITDNTPSCLLMIDPQGCVTFANPATEQITGFRPDELIGRVLHELIHHTHPDGTGFPIEGCPLNRALPLKESVQGYEDVFIHKDGHRYPVRCSARPILKDARSIGTVIEVQDITKERQAAENLRGLATDLERRVRSRTIDLVRSQDRLRTLASQLAMAEQRARHRLATELHDYLAQLLALGRIKLGHARRLLGDRPAGSQPLRELQDILDRALAYTRTVMAELSPPVLHDLGLPAGLEWLGQQMARHGLTVAVTIEQGAAELAARATEDFRVMLFQAARELLINVAKHAGVRTAKVALKREQTDRLLISVRDEGKGFDPAMLDRRGGGGNQFGLFSLRERLEAVGGRMEAESMPGRGTTVTLGVVLSGSLIETSAESKRAGGSKTEGVREMPGQCPDERLIHDASPQRLPIRVLLVDDHVMVRQGLRGILDGYGDVSVVGEAGNGEDAVALVRELRPDVVLMDINMPRMDGLEATANILTEQPGTRVIALSVNSSRQIREAMKAAGAVGFVTKESAADQLYHAVSHAVA